jgi:riboflavin biosynthesis pyrimidine reductase
MGKALALQRVYFLVSKSDWLTFHITRKLFERLQKEFGAAEVRKHEAWAAATEDRDDAAVLRAQCVVAVVSKQTYRSKSFQATLATAREQNKYVVVVTVQEVASMFTASAQRADAQDEATAKPAAKARESISSPTTTSVESLAALLPELKDWIHCPSAWSEPSYAQIKSAVLFEDAATRGHTSLLVDAMAWRRSKVAALHTPERVEEDRKVMGAKFPLASGAMGEFYDASIRFNDAKELARRRRNRVLAAVMAVLVMAVMAGGGVAIWSAIVAAQKTT